MKNLFKALIIALVACMLVGCSGGKKEEPVATGNTAVKIGGSGPLTGGAAQYGIAVKTGAEIAVEEINAKGGLQLDLKFLDDEADGEKAANCYAQLVDWGMQISTLTTTSGSGLAVAPQMQEDGIFGMSPSASAPDVIANKSNIYRMCFEDPEQGTAAAEYIMANGLGKTVAMYVENDSDYSVGIADTFSKSGMNIVETYGYTSDNATDFPVYDVDVVFLPMYYEVATKIISAYTQAGKTPVFFGVDGMDGALEQEGVDPAMFEGVYYLTPFAYSSPDAATQDFVKKFNEKVGTNPNQFAADAYDVVYALYNAMVAANVTPDMSASDIAAAVKAQFATMTYSGLTGSNVTWDDNGAPIKAPLVYRIESGSLVSAD